MKKVINTILSIVFVIITIIYLIGLIFMTPKKTIDEGLEFQEFDINKILLYCIFIISSSLLSWFFWKKK